MAGSTGYDIVVPTGAFLARQIQAGVFSELDKSKLPNIANMDPEIMERVAAFDPENKHAVVYMWGTTAIGYNVAKVEEALGADAPTDSWGLIFDPENAAKLADCGISMLDAPVEIIPAALNYLGMDPGAKDNESIEKAEALLKQIAPHVRYYHSSQYINDLANGDVCVSIGWSGDVFQARDRAETLLMEVGLSNRLNHKPGELSGGEQQRVAVARALMNKPDLILADEPTGNLDERTGEEIHELLEHLNRDQEASFLIATHNPRLAERMDRVVRIADGRILE